MSDAYGAEEPIPELPEVLATGSGVLTIGTDDIAEAFLAWDRFQHHAALEFIRAVPTLASCYELRFVLRSYELGSFKFNFQAIIELKDTVKNALKTATDQATKAAQVTVKAVKMAGKVVLVMGALAGAANEGIDLYDNLFPPAIEEVKKVDPGNSTKIEFDGFRSPDGHPFHYPSQD